MSPDDADGQSDHSLPSEDGALGMESVSQIKTNARPECFRSTIHEVFFVLTATMAIAMQAMLAGSVTVTSNFIGQDLGMTTAEITWLSSSSSLTSGAFLLFFGKIADLFGRKLLFVGSLFLFAVFSLVAGFMKSGISVDIICGVMGLMSASGVPPAVGMLGVIYEKPSKRKNYAFACFSAGNPMGFVFGTIFGGLATNLFGWRASFWLIAIIFGAFAVIGFFVIPADSTDKEPFNLETIKRMDLLGTVLIIFGIGMFSAALSLGDTAPQGWKTGYVLALLTTGASLMIAFVLWDCWYKHPLVPMGIWRDRNFTLCLCIMMLGLAAFTPGNFFQSLFFQQVWHWSALNVAVHLLPMVIVGLGVNVIAGLILHRVSNKLLMAIGTLGYVVCFLLLTLQKESSSYWAFSFPALMLIVLGADLGFNVANMYVMSSMPRSQQSIAGSIFQTATKLCQTVGFGLATAVFNAVQQKSQMSNYWEKGTQPYAAVFITALALSLAGLLLVPFLTIGTQGGKAKPEEASNSTSGDVAELDVSDEKTAEAEATIVQDAPGPVEVLPVKA